MKKRELKKLFRDYPDLVRLPELCAMMGGIGESTARKLLREGHIRSIMVRSTYYIPRPASLITCSAVITKDITPFFHIEDARIRIQSSPLNE